MLPGIQKELEQLLRVQVVNGCTCYIEENLLSSFHGVLTSWLQLHRNPLRCEPPQGAITGAVSLQLNKPLGRVLSCS
jgi:hypothetical protein